ncbi:MAG: hypothetical protein AAF958_17410, partial [Planctomycetota bacterium]
MQTPPRDVPQAPAGETTPAKYLWDFSRRDDPSYTGWPDDWKRRLSVGYPKYVRAKITAKDPQREAALVQVDAALLRARDWGNQFLQGANFKGLRQLPLPPSVADAGVDRYLRVEMDGGRFEARCPLLPASPIYQYRFSCRVACRGLVHDRARVELVFLDARGRELGARAAPPISGTRGWFPIQIRGIVTPPRATHMFVRLSVVGSDNGLEDIRADVGFDDVMIQRYPQLKITTDRRMGVYRPTDMVRVSAKIMGVDAAADRVRLTLLDHDGKRLLRRVAKIPPATADQQSPVRDVDWDLGKMDPGYYTVYADVVPPDAPETRSSPNPAVGVHHSDAG